MITFLLSAFPIPVICSFILFDHLHTSLPFLPFSSEAVPGPAKPRVVPAVGAAAAPGVNEGRAFFSSERHSRFESAEGRSGLFVFGVSVLCFSRLESLRDTRAFVFGFIFLALGSRGLFVASFVLVRFSECYSLCSILSPLYFLSAV
mgnify:CR=1 FL=1